MNRVTSTDGTQIAYETLGNGPALILVGGAFCDRRAKASGTPLAQLLAPHFTVISYDRRSRGDSTEASPWTIEREVEDLAALIAAAGGTASLYGISSGALLAVEAAVRRLPVAKLALYEPPIVLDSNRRPSEAFASELAALTDAGQRGAAVELFLTRVVQVPPPAIAGMQHSPMWSGLEALAHTLAYDMRITSNAPAIVDRASGLAAPVCIWNGTASPPWMHDGARVLANAVAHGETRTLAGQTHDVDPKVLAPALVEWLA